MLSAGMKNRLKDLRYEFKMERQPFAEFLGVGYNQYCKWEAHMGQPNTYNYYCMWEKMKTLKPDIHLEDLMEKK